MDPGTRTEMNAQASCERCGGAIDVEVLRPEGDVVSLECETCGAWVEVGYEAGAEVKVEVLSCEHDAVNWFCPCGDGAGQLEWIEDESGSERADCDACGRELEISWSDWGRSIEVEVRSGPDEDENEEYDDLDESAENEDEEPEGDEQDLLDEDDFDDEEELEPDWDWD